VSPTQLRYAVADGVATITLHRPERLNAFTPVMAAELAGAAAAADADDDVRVVLVTGAGRAFCAGADLGGGEGTFRDRGGRPDPVPRGTVDGVPRDWGGIAPCRSPGCASPSSPRSTGPRSASAPR
jgi:enoyl-CoA hydratase/carnithine racemase